MGRNSTGAWTTNDCLRIELSYLLKAGYLVRGKQTAGSLHWSCNGQPSGNINIFCSWLTSSTTPPYIRLTYITTDRRTGEKEDRDDIIYLEARPSNLGKGEVLYFVCPNSGQRCRILYKAYNGRVWKSRQSYQHRIYYPAQQSSKLDKANNRYWELNDQIEKLNTKQGPETYRGKLTRRAERLQRLRWQQQAADNLRWLPESMTLSVRRAIFDGTSDLRDLIR